MLCRRRFNLFIHLRQDDAGLHLAFRVFRRRSRRRDADLVHARSRFAMAESGATKVQLHVYDLSQGMRARAVCAAPRQADRGRVAHGDHRVRRGVVLRRRHPTGHPRVHALRPTLRRAGPRARRTASRGVRGVPGGHRAAVLPCRRTTCCAKTATTSRTKWRSLVEHRRSNNGSLRLSLPDEVLSTPFGQQLMPMLSMMDAQMRTASEGASVGGSGAARRSRRRRGGPLEPLALAASSARARPAPPMRLRRLQTAASAGGGTSAAAARRTPRRRRRRRHQGGDQSVSGLVAQGGPGAGAAAAVMRSRCARSTA